MAAIQNPPPGGTTTVVATDDRSYIDWPAILAGAVIATAISFVLLTFGSGIGLSMVSAEPGSGVSLFWLAIVAALWLLWVQISSFMAGGYLTGRLRRRHGDGTEHETDVRDGSHGLVVWAAGVVFSGLIAFAGLGGLASTATTAVTTMGAGVATVADDIADQFAGDGIIVDRALRGGPRAQPVGEETRGEVGRILFDAALEGEMSEADRDYLVSIVAARSNLSQEEAEERVDELANQAAEIEAEAREMAETARAIGIVATFLTAASLLISAVGAYFGATLGGKHRDENTIFNEWTRPW